MCKNAFLIPGLPNRLYVPKIVILFDCVISSHEWSLITLSTRELWIKYCSCCECSYVTGFCSVFNHKNLYVFEKHCTTTVSHVFFNKWKKTSKEKPTHLTTILLWGALYWHGLKPPVFSILMRVVEWCWDKMTRKCWLTYVNIKKLCELYAITLSVTKSQCLYAWSLFTID